MNEKIEGWKKAHGNIFELEVKAKNKKCYVRSPGKKDISHATAEASNGKGGFDPIKYSETIFNDCFLGGDEDFKTNDELFLDILPELDKISERAEVIVKKL